jgi:foldase protein PrsA
MQSRGLLKALASIFLVCAALLFLGCNNLSSDTAASVNGTVITKDDVAEQIELMRKRSGMASSDDQAKSARLRRQITDQLVRAELEKQEAAGKGISVTGQDIEDQLQQMAEDQFLSDRQRMMEDYYSKGFSEEELRTEVAQMILHEKLMDTIRQEIPISDEEIQAYYDRNRVQYDLPERRQARQLVTGSESTALEAVSRARTGEDFATLVEQLSNDPQATATKGSIGLIAPGQLPPELESVLFSLNLGDVSDPVKSGDRWYVLRVESIFAPTPKTPEQARGEIREILVNQKFSQRWREYFDGVLANASLEFDPDYDPSLL